VHAFVACVRAHGAVRKGPAETYMYNIVIIILYYIVAYAVPAKRVPNDRTAYYYIILDIIYSIAGRLI